MQWLPKEVIAHIGSFMHENDRRSCYEAAKLFAAVYDFAVYQYKIFQGDLSLEKIEKSVRSIRKMNTNLQYFQLVFADVMVVDKSNLQSVAGRLRDLLDVKNLSVKIYNTSNADLVVSMFNECDIKIHTLTVFLLRVDGVTLEKIPKTADEIIMNLNNYHLHVLENKELCEKITSLSIDMSGFLVVREVNLQHIPDTCDVLMYASTLGLTNIKCLSKIKTLYYVPLYHMGLDSFDFLEDQLHNLNHLVLLHHDRDCANDSYALYKLMNYVSKQTQVHVYVREEPHIIPLLRKLRRMTPNIDVFYYDRETYLVCKVVSHYLPEIDIARMYRYYETGNDYTPSQDLVQLSTLNEIYEAMDPIQQFKWYFIQAGNESTNAEKE